MIRIGTIVWFVVLAMLGVGLFQVKYAVQSKERELRTVNRQIIADREAMRVLEAEWSYLNDPVRLADLTRRHTDLAPVMASQIATFEGLAPRPAEMPALPPLAALPGQAPAGDPAVTAIPASAVVPAPVTPTLAAPAPANDPVFQTSAGAEAPSADDDATIRAILQDMQSHQSGDAEPAAGSGKSLPANEAGVE
ncbi:hypothetical protein [Dongia mobilis]|jgi:hypothetical protein|uniref:cell division protein FtsL n=1 Tax=Dongia sp. TaxID=1977262 RepID=UPI0026F1F731